MTGAIAANSVLSRLTLAVLEDSGLAQHIT